MAEAIKWGLVEDRHLALGVESVGLRAKSVIAPTAICAVCSASVDRGRAPLAHLADVILQ
jgi:hypothetical protein